MAFIRGCTLAALAAAVVSFGAACGVNSTFVQTVGYQRANRSPDQIDVFLEGQVPKRPYKTVGIVSTKASALAPVKLMSVEPYMKALREKAAEAGLDGVYDVHVGAPGTVGANRCQGTGFVYE